MMATEIQLPQIYPNRFLTILSELDNMGNNKIYAKKNPSKIPFTASPRGHVDRHDQWRT